MFGCHGIADKSIIPGPCNPCRNWSNLHLLACFYAVGRQRNKGRCSRSRERQRQSMSPHISDKLTSSPPNTFSCYLSSPPSCHSFTVTCAFSSPTLVQTLYRHTLHCGFCHSWILSMNSANEERPSDLEQNLGYYPSLSPINEKESSKVVPKSKSDKMSKLQHCIFALLVLCFLTVRIVTANLNRAPQDEAHRSADSRFQQLLNTVDPSALHEVLHENLKDKYRHGVFHEDRTALEAIHHQNAAAAESLVELAKRQATTSGNGTVVTTTALTTTETVVTATESITSPSAPPPTPPTTQPETQSFSEAPTSLQSTFAPEASAAPTTPSFTTAAVISASTPEATSSSSAFSSSSDLVQSSTSPSPTSQGTYRKKRSLFYPFTPMAPLSMLHERTYRNFSTTSALDFLFPMRSSSMNIMTYDPTLLIPFMAASSSVSANTTSSRPASSQYASALPNFVLLNTTTSNPLNVFATSLPTLCDRAGSAACAAGPTTPVTAHTTSMNATSLYVAIPGSSLMPNTTLGAHFPTFNVSSETSSPSSTSLPYVVAQSSSVPANATCLSSASTPYAGAPSSAALANTLRTLPTQCLRDGSGCAAAPTMSVLANATSSSPASSLHAVAPINSISTNSLLSLSNSTYPVSNTTIATSSSHVFNTSTSGSSSTTTFSAMLFHSSLSSTIFFTSDTAVASTSKFLTSSQSSAQSSTRTSPSSTRTTIYTTTLPNGAKSTVTSVTVIPVGADQMTGGPGTATTTGGNASLQTGGVAKVEVGLSALLGGAVMMVMGSL